MRIMTRDAADPRICTVEAFAVGEAIRLETHVNFPPPFASHNRFPRAMALSAEVRNVFGRKLPQIGGSGLRCFILKRGYQMSLCSRVAVFAGYAGLDMSKFKFACCDGAGGMAAEAIFRFRSSHFASDGFIEVLRSERLVSSCNFESVDRRVIAHHALEEFAVFLQNPGLRALAETPVNGKRDGSSAIAYRVDGLVVLRFYRVGIAAFDEAKFWMALEERISIGPLHAASHRRIRLRYGLSGMAAGASRRDVFVSSLRGRGYPHTEEDKEENLRAAQRSNHFRPKAAG